jgi:hypothetical protein
MSIPPEVLFHRCFQRQESNGPPSLQGQEKLGRCPSNIQLLLASIQEALNEASHNEKKNVPEHVNHPPFHFDYVDSTVPNALAFRFEDYSFIGLTMPLIEMLWETCTRLSMADVVGSLLLGVRITPGLYEVIHARAVLYSTNVSGGT